MSDDRTAVLWLVKGLGPGGAERLLVNHAVLGDHDRFRYEVAYTVAQKDQLAAEMIDAGVTVHRPPAGRAAQDPRRLRRLARDRAVDVVHVHSPLLGGLTRPLLRASRSRPALVTTEHNRWPMYRPLTRALNAATLRLDDHVFAVSGDVAASVGSVWRRQVEVLHHGVLGDRLRARAAGAGDRRAALGVAPDELLAVVVANFRPEKDHANVLAAAEQMGSGCGIRILLVGQGPLLDEVRAAVRDRNLSDRVAVLGFREDVVEILASSDLLLLGSRHEGLPVAVMEAFALGVPVVATAVGGVPEAVRDGREGLLVPPGDASALSGALARLRDDRTLLRALADGARSRGSTFEAAAAVERQEQVYEELARAIRGKL